MPERTVYPQKQGLVPADEPIQTERITLVHSGEDYFQRLLSIISNAKREIHLQTYIFDHDATGKEIMNALKEASGRGVQVYLLLDGYGSSSLSGEVARDLRQHGIHIRFFSPLFSGKNFYLSRRLHHKVIVADGEITMIGGINIADKYKGTSTEEPWLDYAVQIENSMLASELEQLCRNIYTKGKRKKIRPNYSLDRETSVSILQNDWLKRKNEIANAYLKALRESKEEVIIVGSYFLPGRKLTNALKKASGRGVKIKLLLSGVSDVPLIRSATRHLYSSLLKHNIELFEWNRSVLHGKAAVSDNAWSTIGSFNLNHLSSYGSIEMNAEIQSTEFAGVFASHLNTILSKCERITNEKMQLKNNIFTKIANWTAYRLIRTALWMITHGNHA